MSERSWPARLITHHASLITGFVLALMIAGYAVAAGGLALRRHWNLESQALDMGYADQVAWNTLHGRPFRFTVFRGDVGAELGRPLRYGPGADRDSLLAYHVELLFLPLSLLYLVHAGPETLVVLLTVVLALGALPAYWIAQRQLGHRGAALCFAALYLLFPSIQAANLSDFHAVSMAGALLLFALHFLLARRYRAFAVMAAISAAAKEEVGLLVAMMGLYAWLVQRQRRLGLAAAGLSLAWVLLCFGVIIPHFNGGAPSLFAGRYGDALERLRAFPVEVLAGRPALPLPDYTVRYVGHLLASTGFLALLAPAQLALAAPVLGINGFSGSTWQHGGGAHYSAEVVPGLVVASIYGARHLAAACWRWLKVPPATAALGIALAGLAIALVESRSQGILPPSPRFMWPPPSEHAARLRPLLAQVPAGAAVSAQSNVFPHLSRRERAYVFPTMENAEYVLVDVAGTSDPLYPDDLFTEAAALLASPRYRLLAADDGFLLFRRFAPGTAEGGSPAATPPASFYEFARAAERFTPVHGSFAGGLDVAGYAAEPMPVVSFAARYVRPAVYFRARAPLDRAYRLTTFLIGRDELPRVFDDGNAAQLWYPTNRWRPGELVRVRYPPIPYGAGHRLGVGAQIGAGAGASRLRVSEASAPVLDGGRVLLLGPLP